MKYLSETSDFDNHRLFDRINQFRAHYIAKIWNTKWHASPEVLEAIDKWRDEGHDWIVKTERERYGKLQDR